MDLVEIVITAKNLTKPAFDSVAADSKILSSTMGKMGLGAGAALLGIGVESVKMASTFQQQMTRMGTQAGVSTQTMGEIQKGVLSLAGQVGFSPLSLAKAAYYVESNFSSMGITTKQALELVKIAAQGAAVGGSDLVATTTALNATVALGIPGVQDYSKAMGALNAIVGTGEMTMTDLVQALGSGVLAVVKGYGLTITDVGAALTTFGDNNIRGAVAATDLRMAVQALAVPAKGAASYLKEFGWTAKTLQTDMQNHGLVYVLDELHAKFLATGISAKEQGAVITEMFGKKAGAGLAVLLGNMDRIDSKVPALQAAMNSFAGAWEQQKHTFSQQMKDIQAGFDAMMIRLGLFLMPKVSEFITLVQSHGTPVVHEFAKALAGIGAGFSMKAPTMAPASGQGHQQAGAGDMAPPALTAWEQAGKVLKGIAADFATFFGQLRQSLANLIPVVQAAAQVLGVALLVALKAVGVVLATVVGPILVAVTGFLKDHTVVVQAVVAGYLAVKAVEIAFAAATWATGIAINAVQIATKAWAAALVVWSVATKAATAISGFFTTAAIAGQIAIDGAQISTKLWAAATVVWGVVCKAAAGFTAFWTTAAIASQIALDDAGIATKVWTAATVVWGVVSKAATGIAALWTTAAIAAQIAMDDAGIATKAWAAAQWLLNFAMDANPIGAVTAAIGLLVTATFLLYNHSELVRQIFAIAWPESEIAAVTAAHGILVAMKVLSDGVMAAVGMIIHGLAAAFGGLPGVGGMLKDAARSFDGFRASVDSSLNSAIGITNDFIDTTNKATQIKVLQIEIGGWNQNIATAKANLASVPASKRADILATITDLQNKIRAAQNTIDGLQGKTVTIYFNGVATGITPPPGYSYQSTTGFSYAHGGIVSAAASGGARGGLVQVGENGPELVHLPGGSMVYSNAQSRAMAAAGGGGQRVILELHSGGSGLDDALVEILRYAVRVRGGNVQTAIGQN